MTARPGNGAKHSGMPRCMHCAYVLDGLPTRGACPECGCGYDLDVPSTYTTKPPFIGWKYWLPGLATAAALGVATYYLTHAMGNRGVSLWFAVPLAAGCALGYGVRVRGLVLVFLALWLVPTVILGLFSLSLVGVVCGATLGAIVVGPVLAGTGLGAGLRHVMKRTGFSQRAHLPVIFVLFLLPMVCAAIEGPPRAGYALERVSTEAEMNAGTEACWDAIVFYEEVTHRPPLLMRLILPRPLRTVGEAQEVGDVKTCVYERGRLVKRIEEVRRGEVLGFSVAEESIGFDHDVRLIGGSFSFEEIGRGRTRVTLATDYEPLLGPRWCWRPFERLIVQTLHEHVLEGMRERTDAPAAFAKGGG